MAHTLSRTAVTTLSRPGLFAFAAAAFGAWRQRRALAGLDAHARRDLGLSADEVHIEASRPIWDVPQTWRF